MKNSIAIIGCGNLGKAIAHGILRDSEFNPASLTLTRRKTSALAEFENMGVNVLTGNSMAVANSEIIILGVKPFNVGPILEEIAKTLDPKKHILVSLATGITLDEISKSSNQNFPIVRAMPNIGADIGESITCIAHRNCSDKQVSIIKELFDHVGETITIDESLMEAATVLGACGVAYVLRFMRAMIQGGIQIGFDSETASKIVNQTVKGAAELMIKGDMHPEEAIDKVTTPKGCTIVGLNEMEHHGFSSSMVKGVIASFEKIEK